MALEDIALPSLRRAFGANNAQRGRLVRNFAPSKEDAFRLNSAISALPGTATAVEIEAVIQATFRGDATLPAGNFISTGDAGVRDAILNERTRLVALSDINLPRLRGEIQRYFGANGLLPNPTTDKVAELNARIAELSAGGDTDRAAIEAVIHRVWPQIPADYLTARNGGAVHSKELRGEMNRLQHLASITSPALRGALQHHGGQPSQFTPTAAQVVQFNEAIAALGLNCTNADIDRVIQQVWRAVRDAPPADLIQNDAVTGAAIVEDVQRFARIEKIGLPKLRDALKLHALLTPGFKPTEDEIRKLNAKIAELPPAARPLDQAVELAAIAGVINTVWPRAGADNFISHVIVQQKRDEIVDERNRLVHLSGIHLLELRAALQRHGGATAAFNPTVDQVRELNAAIAALPAGAADAGAIGQAVSLVFAAVNGPRADFIRTDPVHSLAIVQERNRLEYLSKINLPELRGALQRHGGTDLGFRPTEAEILQLNAKIAALPVPITAANIDAAINSVTWTAGGAPGARLLQDDTVAGRSQKVVDEVNRLKELSKIDLPELRGALERHGAANPGFIPTEAEVRQLNAAIAALLAGANEGQIDAAIQTVAWAAGGAIAQLLQNDPVRARRQRVVDEQVRLQELSNISLPELRGALQRHGGATPGFQPTADEVRRLNAAIAELPTSATAGQIDGAIQKVWQFAPGGNNPAVDLIATDETARCQRIVDEQIRLQELSKINLPELRGALQRHGAITPGFRPTANDVADLNKRIDELGVPPVLAAAIDAAIQLWPADPNKPGPNLIVNDRRSAAIVAERDALAPLSQINLLPLRGALQRYGAATLGFRPTAADVAALNIAIAALPVGANEAAIDNVIQGWNQAGMAPIAPVAGLPARGFIANNAAAKAAIVTEQQRLAPLSKITLPLLRDALHRHGGANPGFIPLAAEVDALNSAIAGLARPADEVAIDGAIHTVWPVGAAPAPVNPPAAFIAAPNFPNHAEIVTEVRLAPLAKIKLPHLREALENHARGTVGFTPTAAQVADLNTRMAALAVPATAVQIDGVIQVAWNVVAGIPANNLIAADLARSPLVVAEHRLAPLAEITLPGLRAAIERHGVAVDGFQPKPDEVQKLNAKIAALPLGAGDQAIDDAIQTVWQAQPLVIGDPNPADNLIQADHVHTAAIVAELTRLQALSKINLPELRGALQRHGGAIPGFQPTDVQVAQFNERIAALGANATAAAIDGVIQTVWSVGTLHNPVADLIQSDVDHVTAIVNEQNRLAPLSAIKLPELRGALQRHGGADSRFTPTVAEATRFNAVFAGLAAGADAAAIDGAIQKVWPVTKVGAGNPANTLIQNQVVARRDAILAEHRYAPLAGINLPILRGVLEAHARAQAGFIPTAYQVAQLNAALVGLPAGSNAAAIDGAIQAIWPVGALGLVAGTNPAADMVVNAAGPGAAAADMVNELRLAPLEGIKLPLLRDALKVHGAGNNGFQPTATEVVQLNAALAGLAPAVTAAAIDTEIQKVWVAVTQGGRFIQVHGNEAPIVKELRLAPLSKITLPELRAVLMTHADGQNGFIPTVAEVTKLNAAIAALPVGATANAVDTEIQKIWKFDAANAAFNPAANLAHLAAARIGPELRLAPLSKVSLPTLREALEVHARANPGFSPSASDVADLNRRIAGLVAGAGALDIDTEIANVWPIGGANPPAQFILNDAARCTAIIEELRLAPLSKISLPTLREAIKAHALITPGFTPTAAQVTKLNAEIVALAPHVDDVAIDGAIQRVWQVGGPGYPGDHLIRNDADRRDAIVAEQIRLTPLAQVTLPSLRAALEAYAAEHIGFVPSAAEIVQLNQDVAANVDLQAAIVHIWPADAAHPHHPPANFIAEYENKDAILNEHRVSRLVADIKDKVKEISGSAGESHPELVGLIQGLPANKMQDILDDPDKKNKLPRLLSATSKFELLAAARDCGFDGTTLTKATGDALIAENERHRAFHKLGNSKIAEVLARFPINLKTKPDLVKNLNVIITRQPAPANYDRWVNDLFVATGLNAAQYSAAFDSAFGIPAPGVAPTPAQTADRTAVVDQQQQNAHLYAEMDQLRQRRAVANAPLENGRLAALYVLARLEKKAPADAAALTVPQINTLVGALQNSANDAYAKFIKAPAIQGLLVGAVKDFDKQGLFEEMFDVIQCQNARDKLGTSGQATKDALAELTKQYAAMEKQLKAFVSLGVREDLEVFLPTEQDNLNERAEALGDLPAFAWLDGANEGIARQYASELLPEFEALSAFCEDACVGLQLQLDALRKMEASLPNEPAELARLKSGVVFSDERDNIKAQRTIIQDQIKYNEIGLARYQRVHTWLNGDLTAAVLPGRPKFVNEVRTMGMLPILRRAKTLQPLVGQAKKDAQANPLTGDSGFVDVPCKTKKEIEDALKVEAARTLSQNYVPAPPGAAMHVGHAEINRVFANKGALAEGDIRIQTVYTSQANSEAVSKRHAGMYYEQDGKPQDKKADSKEIGIVQPVKMTVAVFPSDPNESKPTFTEANRKALQMAKVEFTTKMAMDMLVRMGKSPTAEDPIVLTGSNKEQVGMLWAALVQLGKVHPEFKFDEKAIEVDAACFDPKEEKPWGGLGTGPYTKMFTEGDSGRKFQTMAGVMKTKLDKSLGATPEQQATLKADFQKFIEFKGKFEGGKPAKKVAEEFREGPKGPGAGGP